MQVSASESLPELQLALCEWYRCGNPIREAAKTPLEQTSHQEAHGGMWLGNLAMAILPLIVNYWHHQ